jgi:hypothetical protein
VWFQETSSSGIYNYFLGELEAFDLYLGTFPLFLVPARLCPLINTSTYIH